MKKIVKLLSVFAVLVCCMLFMTEKAEAKESKDYVIKVNLGTNCVTIYKEGKPVKAMICSPSEETPVGTFYTPQKYRWHEMIGNCYAQYCTRITTGILFHSVWYYKNGDKSTMSVSAYNVMGQKASHGCVRLLCEDAKWIYDNCALGTKVTTFWGTSKDDPLGRPGFTPIKTGAVMSWDPTDPDPANPYQKVKPKITPKKTKIEYKSKVTAKTAVTIKDCLGNTLTSKNAKIKIKGKINTKKTGTYKVTYTVTDSMGNKQKKTIKFKVVDTKKPKITGARSKKNITMGSTVNVLTGVKAKTVPGANITHRLKVKVVKTSNKKNVKVTKGKVKFAAAGKYKVTYTVKGYNKKTAKKVVYYTVVDKRVMALMTDDRIILEQGQEFNPLSYVYLIKSYKGDSIAINSKNVTTTGNVNTNVPGTYKVTYYISNNGNEYTKTTKTLIVIVKAKEETTTGQEEQTTEVVTPEEETTETETTEPDKQTAETETTKAEEETAI